MAETYSVEAMLKASGTAQFVGAMSDSKKSVENLANTTGKYTQAQLEAIKKSGGMIDAQGRLRSANGRYMSAAEKARHGLEDFGKSTDNTSRKVDGATFSIGKFIAATTGVLATVGIFNLLRSSVDGAISRFDTLNNFPKVMEQMGFSAGDSKKAIDKLSEGIQGLPTALDEVASTSQRIAILTNDLEGATDTTLALNNAFLLSGSGAADVSRGLQQYTQMLSRGEVDLESWRTLQETMGVALNETAKAFGFAGASAQNDLYAALKDGTITFDQFNAKIVELNEGTNGFAERAKTASGGLRTAFTNMRTAIVRGVTGILQSIDEMLVSNGLPKMQDIVSDFGKKFEGVLKQVAASIGPVATTIISIYNAIKPFAPIILAVITTFLTFATVVGIVNSVRNAIVSLKAAMVVLNATLLANPVGIVIAVLAGLAVLFIHLYKTSETFKNGVNAAFAQLKAFVMPIVQVVVSYIMSLWGSLVSWWEQNSAQILSTAQNVWNTIVSVVSSVVGVLVDYILTAWGNLTAWWNQNGAQILANAQTVWNTIVSVITTVVGEVVNFVMVIWGMLTSFWQTNGQMILQAAQNVWSVIQTVITTAVTVIWNVIQVAMNVIWTIMQLLWPLISFLIIDTWNAIQGVIQGAISVITGIIQFFAALFTGNWSAMWDAVKQIVSGAVQLIWNLVQLWFLGKILGAGKLLFTGLRSIVTSLWTAIRSLFTNGVNTASSVVSAGFNLIRSVVSNVMNAIRSLTSTSWNGIKGTITNVLNAIKGTVRLIFNSLKGVVTNAFSAVKTAVSTGIKNALNVITNLKNSFKEAGRNIVTSIASGIRAAIGSVTDAIGSVTSAIRNFLPFSPAKEGALRDIMKIQIPQSIAESINKGKKVAVGAMRSLTDSINGEMPVVDLAGSLKGINKSAQREMSLNYQNEITYTKQPAIIKIQLGQQEIERFTEDINDVNAVSDVLRRF